MKLVAILSVIAFGAVGFLLLNNNSDSSLSNSETEELINKSEGERQESVQNADRSVLDTKLIIGDSSADVTIVEYFDYKCPNCNTFHRLTKPKLKELYPDNEINFEMRTTPIIGPDSARAARGAYCSSEQNLFSEYHDSVMNYIWDNYYSSGDFDSEFDDILTEEVLLNVMSNTSLNQTEFTQCVTSLKYNPALDRDLLAAADDGVRGTPAFVIGDQSFVGTQPISVFEALIEAQR